MAKKIVSKSEQRRVAVQKEGKQEAGIEIEVKGSSKSLDEILQLAKKVVGKCGKENRTPTKVMKMKPEWKKLHDEAEVKKDEAEEAKRVAIIISEEMWAKIRRDLGYPRADFHISEDGSELQIFEAEK